MKIDVNLQNKWRHRQAIALLEYPDLGTEALSWLSHYLPGSVLAALGMAEMSLTMAIFSDSERLIPTLVVEYSGSAVLADSQYFDDLKQLSHYAWLILGISQVTVCGKDRHVVSSLASNQNTSKSWILSTLRGYK
jgi:hypothetical protein